MEDESRIRTDLINFGADPDEGICSCWVLVNVSGEVCFVISSDWIKGGCRVRAGQAVLGFFKR